jgi:hypothetical protein
VNPATPLLHGSVVVAAAAELAPFRGVCHAPFVRWVALGLVVACVVLCPVRADACSFGPLETHSLDESEKAVDSTSPTALGTSSYTVERGHGPERSGCTETASSCDGTGNITLYLGEVSDDRTPEEKLGFRVELVAGNAPSNSTWPSDPNAPSATVRAHVGRTLFLHFEDGEDEDQEAIDFTLRVRAVDLAGNEGPPTEIRIRDSGSDSGCRVASGSVDLSPVFALLLGALAWARARSSSSSSRRGAASSR